MKTLLFISYHYPPIASPGAERARAFARYLPELGYRVRVLTTSTYGGDIANDVVRTGEPVGYYRRALNPDSAKLPESQRSRSRTESGWLGEAARWVKDRCMIPDGEIGWAPGALAQGLEATRRGEVDAIMTSSPPHSSHLVGRAIKAETGLPWVAEFRDTWTYDPLNPSLRKPGARRSVECWMERMVLEAADRVVGVTDVACAHLAAAGGGDRVRRVTNGFEPDDVVRGNSPAGGEMKLVHVGSFSRSHVERRPDALISALAGLGTGDVILALVGALTDGERRLAEGAGPTVAAEGAVAKDVAMARQAEADVLVLVDHPRDVRASNVPSKCYEYLATGKPILALVPEGATRDLIVSTNAGICAEPGDVTGIRESIDILRRAWRDGTLDRWGASEEAVAPYRRRETAADLARCLDEVT